MDTKSVADALGTDPRILRRFLRDPGSTFQAVGSGARYVFTETDLPELERRFNAWAGNKQTNRVTVPKKPPVDEAAEQLRRDMAVWEEEGPVVIPDIRDPWVRRQVQEGARRAEAALEARLMAAGMHLSQMTKYRAA
jgi:hypothetical protein